MIVDNYIKFSEEIEEERGDLNDKDTISMF